LLQKTSQFQETDQGYQFVAVYAIEPLCVYCHSSDIQRFGKKEQDVQIDEKGKASLIKGVANRYLW